MLNKFLRYLTSRHTETRTPLERNQLKYYPKFEGEHPSIWVFPEYLNNPNCNWLQCLKEQYGMPITFPASLSPEAGLMLHSLVRNLAPKIIIEVGVFCSISTQWMASALLENSKTPGQNAIIHCFDDFGPIHKGPWRDVEMLSGRLDFVSKRLEKAGTLDYVRFHPGDSSSNIIQSQNELVEAGGVDLAFIDGDHSIPGVLADFKAVEPVLNTGGYVLLHDTYPEQCGNHKGPRYIIDHLIEIGQGFYEQVELHLSPLNFGMSLIRRIG